ncbi:superfamily II DNA or RNA helicase [Deinobacterium chartae]|uniref:DNA 3'-5' helicase n=1 Tax=Deinobacterium chartae TaxID=521158 RepID=A0A841HYA6_9DEIO|nr:DEAD/DEAH box helicase family protein [Deinobacterium chartae]MBB6096918.1 superfamily II DNA or RNA helicase [Deinobacterium chartae]
MARPSTLTFDRGTLVLHPPPKARSWLEHCTWDDRVERFRAPAQAYRPLLEGLRAEGVTVLDRAAAFVPLEIGPAAHPEPFVHQREALEAWTAAEGRGVVVLPTGAGKTLVAQLALRQVARSTLIVVPTLDLMQQWYAGLLAAFPGLEVGLLGGGSRDDTPLLVATYDSAAIHAERLGNRYGLLIFDECHHLPADFSRVIAEYAIAPWRLGLSATPERADQRHEDLAALIGPTVYRRSPGELAGQALADYREERILATLSDDERARYDALIEKRNRFLAEQNIRLGSLEGWQRFVKASGRSRAGRAAMLAHREARGIAFGTESKLRVLAELLARHAGERTLIFTDDNAAVYRVSREFLVPAITHRTPVKERHANLERFRDGRYPVLVTSRVLNEGVDVPEASVAIVLSGTATVREYVQRLGRILRRQEGKTAVLYEVVAENTAEENVSRRRRGEEPLGASVQPPAPARPVPHLEADETPVVPVRWEDF